MQARLLLALQVAAAIFVLLFIYHFVSAGPNPVWKDEAQTNSEGFEIGRKNYASFGGKMKAVEAVASPELSASGSQKYEKIGSLTQTTTDFDPDRGRVDELIKTNAGVVQLERAIGLKGNRSLQLGIGVPPEKFDVLIASLRDIGEGSAIEIVKNDKTNEYLQLGAKRATLEKARAALDALKSGGGSTDERVNVQTKLTEIEQQIQDLGVSLGEFDSQNELCTVKLTLRERSTPKPWSARYKARIAFQRAVGDYMQLGIGFFGLAAAFALGIWALRTGLAMLRP
jgi:hypothetical protein